MVCVGNIEVVRKRDMGKKKGGSEEDPEETAREIGGKAVSGLSKAKGRECLKKVFDCVIIP